MPRFKTKGLESIRRDTVLFHDVSFQLNDGELLQIDGINGSGKSTLLRICAGLTLANSGTVCWDRQPIQSSRQHFNQAMSYVGHLNGIRDTLTIRENLQVIHALAGASAPLDSRPVLDRMGLAVAEDNLAGKLSAGQKRRLGLARLLLKESRLWLLDEPFTSLDREGKERIEELILAHCRQGGITVFATHQRMEIAGAAVRHIHLGARQ